MRSSARPEAWASRHPEHPHAARCAVTRDPHVSQLGGAAGRPSIQAAVEHQTAAHARAQRQHHHVAQSPGRAHPGLGERGRVGVVVQGGRQPSRGRNPGAHRRVVERQVR